MALPSDPPTPQDAGCVSLPAEEGPTRPCPARASAIVTIAMPALNEARYIEAAIRSVLPDHEDVTCELIVVDGGSCDETCAIVERLARDDDRIRLLHNPERRQAAGVNLAAKHARADSTVLVRADCHAVYPPGFVRRLLQARDLSGATSVVVAMHTRGEGCQQKGIAAAQNSRMGNGGSAHRLRGLRGFIDHGHHAAIDMDMFLALGGYDNDGHQNEDAEFDCRLTAAGGLVFLDGTVVIDYFPRDTLTALAVQYANYGVGRANTTLRHRKPLKLRQIAPVAILIGVIGGIAAAALSGEAWPLIVPGTYALVVVAISTWLSLKQRSLCALFAAPAAMTMHLAWGAGFIWRFVVGRRTGPERPKTLHNVSRRVGSGRLVADGSERTDTSSISAQSGR